MTYNSHKTNGWCNNHNYKYFMGSHLSKLHHLSDPHRLSYTNYRITLVSSTYINYCCKNNLLYCCSLCLHNSAISFQHKAIVHKPVFIKWLFTFKQRILIHMHMCTCGCQAMVTETSKTTNFWACFFETCFYTG